MAWLAVDRSGEEYIYMIMNLLEPTIYIGRQIAINMGNLLVNL